MAIKQSSCAVQVNKVSWGRATNAKSQPIIKKLSPLIYALINISLMANSPVSQASISPITTKATTAASSTDLITGLYVTYFNRAPDKSGLAYWKAQADANGNTAALYGISSAFAQNAVALINFPANLTNTQFVSQMYKYALSIDTPDTSGVNFWAGRLTAGTSRSNLMVEFISAILNYDATQDSTSTASEKQAALDAQAMVKNKIDAGLYFATNILGVGDKSNVPLDAQGNPDVNSAQYRASIEVLSGVTKDKTTISASYVKSQNYLNSLSTEVIPNDSLFTDQWHLKNTGQTGRDSVAGKVGEDLNVTRAWGAATGNGIQIAVIDDGLDINHEDLDVVPGKSWDYRINAYGDPSSSTGSHGTSCAGLAAAKGNNTLGVTGVAYNAKLVGYNLLAATTGSNGADAVTKDLQANHVYSNSYGASDGTGLLQPSDEVWRQAIDTGISTGRNGKGSVYLWAAGNGASAAVDRSDYDGSANYQGVFAIGSLNDQGVKSSYSELGSNLLVMTYGGEFCATHTTTTVDISGVAGYNNGTSSADDYNGQPNYTRCMNGTSAATPEASGTVALLLEANPSLTWRDVRAILATTARKNDPNHTDWVTNGAGMRVNHNYGYGAINANAAVAAAKAWQNLPAQKSSTATASIASPIPVIDNGAAINSTITLAGSNISKLEFVDVNVTSDHGDVGDLEITLTSPAGTVSTLTVVHDCKNGETTITCGAALANGTRFGVARLMGEAADGDWKLSVRDGKASNTGSLTAWSIKAYGY